MTACKARDLLGRKMRIDVVLDLVHSRQEGFAIFVRGSAAAQRRPPDDDEFIVVDRDNQAGPDAAIKRIYQFSVDDLEPLKDTDIGTTPAFPVVSKTLVRDLMPDLEATNGLVLEKIEGLAVLPNGDVLVVNDNDGVDDSNGETQLLTFEELLHD